nr:immunoglobulin heavy chain junction region [Macaca mulatta]MOV53887.1 immunoglobulin heavy chain junction region [Macaca mulatta]MOV53927.1 immunoglobulin heavy chain junction region [Macaca mulatta]MOV53986.1 immunoglobulin heavy chain junction region [Macaca mulatta]MOV54185.1 immunoglobulin heavy chain junction region [Macaca mulatta]
CTREGGGIATLLFDVW